MRNNVRNNDAMTCNGREALRIPVRGAAPAPHPAPAAVPEIEAPAPHSARGFAGLQTSGLRIRPVRGNGTIEKPPEMNCWRDFLKRVRGIFQNNNG
ncbi:MAG: hypothetical protein LBB61_07400 [Treponema sp.]|nr:hypothetical protein [Treponema sp.]